MAQSDKLHDDPKHFIQVIENALCAAYQLDTLSKWNRIYDFYERRYLNPSSPYKQIMQAYTDYPITMLGDAPGKPGPIRQVRVLSFDGDRYCCVEFSTGTGSCLMAEVKAGYLYTERGRHGEVPTIDTTLLTRNDR